MRVEGSKIEEDIVRARVTKLEALRAWTQGSYIDGPYSGLSNDV